MIAATVCAACSSAAVAQVFTFAIDPALSNLSLSGQAFSSEGSPLPLDPQAPGSMDTSYTGTITAELTGSTITLLSSSMDADVSGTYDPGPAPGDYGFQADSGNPLIGSLVGAARDAVFSLTSGAIPLTAKNAAQSFDLSTATFEGLNGQVDFDGEGQLLSWLSGQSFTLVGQAATTVSSTTPATYMDVGGIKTLTLPFSANYVDFVSGAAIDLTLEGTIVATVPEPATLGLLILGTAALALRRRR